MNFLECAFQRKLFAHWLFFVVPFIKGIELWYLANSKHWFSFIIYSSIKLTLVFNQTDFLFWSKQPSIEMTRFPFHLAILVSKIWHILIPSLHCKSNFRYVCYIIYVCICACVSMCMNVHVWWSVLQRFKQHLSRNNHPKHFRDLCASALQHAESWQEHWLVDHK